MSRIFEVCIFQIIEIEINNDLVNANTSLNLYEVNQSERAISEYSIYVFDNIELKIDGLKVYDE